jgi:hypothetical protein
MKSRKRRDILPRRMPSGKNTSFRRGCQPAHSSSGRLHPDQLVTTIPTTHPGPASILGKTHNYGGRVGASLVKCFCRLTWEPSLLRLRLYRRQDTASQQGQALRTEKSASAHPGRPLFSRPRLSWRADSRPAASRRFLSSALVRYLSQAGTMILLALLILFILFSRIFLGPARPFLRPLPELRL